MDAKLHKKLEDRRSKGTLRSLSSFEGTIDFISNDYLGLSSYNVKSEFRGSTGSRLISGNSAKVESVEADLAAFYGYESALCFNSGYDANLGALSSIPQKGDIILFDEYIHASARDGIRLSLAKSYSFKHNDVADLTRLLLNNHEATCYVVVESLYSMHGDMAPLDDIASVIKDHGAYLIVDEAHAAGVFGESGKGLTNEYQVDDSVFLKLITFGKAYGAHGACVLAGIELKEYLINFARPFIYSTALPEESYLRMQALTKLDLSEERRQLFDLISYFRDAMKDAKIQSNERSPIQVINGSKAMLENLVLDLSKNKISAKAIFSPTVPEGSECIRVCIHSFNTTGQIDALLVCLKGMHA